MKAIYLILIAIVLTSSAAFAQTPPQNPGQQSDLRYAPGDLVEAQDYRGVWYKSRIVSVDKGKYTVHYFGWDDAWNEAVTPEKVRTSDDPEFGREVEVEQKGVYYKAWIIDSRYNAEHLVAYVGYNEDEWVKNERIRDSRGVGTGSTGSGIGFKWGTDKGAGKIVEVPYGKGWRKAEILKRRPGEVYVHYVGEDDVWNEWVSESKIRPRR